ncbi:MAG: hypothetical protein C5B54_01945 [Acidobacteria bacterium]|nr:MAG: hypothetical protein C5B54_01945 [Acidobacteriota bacterium]
MLKSFYIIGGQQKYLRPLLANDADWYAYDKGVLLEVNPEAKTSRLLVEYTSPPEARAGYDGATLFKSGSIKNDVLYACTQTEILMYKLPQAEQIGYISLPSFNDVHHVRPSLNGNNNLFIASSGLDVVLEVTSQGEMVRHWSALGEDPWQRFSKNMDYRHVNTKPHRSHPNHVFFVDGELWTTRFCQMDAVSLHDPERRIEIGIGRPHDGMVAGDYIYFTTVNGNVIVANKQTLKTEEIIDLNTIHNYDGPLGWCRGLLIDGDKLWVGFSRIRPTYFRENVEWIKRSIKWKILHWLPSSLIRKNKRRRLGLNKELPTHITCYDLKNRKCMSEMNLEPHGVSAVFSILSND